MLRHSGQTTTSGVLCIFSLAKFQVLGALPTMTLDCADTQKRSEASCLSRTLKYRREIFLPLRQLQSQRGKCCSELVIEPLKDFLLCSNIL